MRAGESRFMKENYVQTECKLPIKYQGNIKTFSDMQTLNHPCKLSQEATGRSTPRK